MAKRQGRFDSGDKYDEPEVFYDGPPDEPTAPILIPTHNLSLNQQTNMEYWEFTKDRAQKTLPVWQQYVPDLSVGQKTAADLDAMIALFEPAVQSRTAAQDDVDEAFRAVQSALLKMKILGTKVPKLIEGHLDENAGIMSDVDDLYATNPRTEASILKRARMLYPVWLRANAAMAALSPTQPAITRAIQSAAHTAAMLKGLLDGYTELVKTMEDKAEALDRKREELRALDAQVDRLNKNWYKIVKEGNDPGSPVYEALAGIPTEPATPPPDPIEIEEVSQGGVSCPICW